MSGGVPASAPRVLPRIPQARGVILAGALAAALCAVWALWPLPAVHVDTPRIEAGPPAPEPTRTVEPLDTAAFRTPLWVAQPPPPPPPAPAPPPPPLRLQLVAIVREGDVYKAALYDPDQDRLLVVGAGERIGSRLVEEVSAGEVTLKDGALTRTLALREENRP